MDQLNLTHGQSTDNAEECVKLKNCLNKLKFCNKQLTKKLNSLKNTHLVLEIARNKNGFEFDCSSIVKKIEIYQALERKTREENRELAYLKDKQRRAGAEMEKKLSLVEEEFKHMDLLSESIDQSASLAHFNYLKDKHFVYITRRSYNLARKKRSSSMHMLKTRSRNMKDNLQRRLSVIQKDRARRNCIMKNKRNFAVQLEEVIRNRNENKEISQKVNQKLSFYTESFQTVNKIIRNSIFHKNCEEIDASDIVEAWKGIQSAEDKLNERYVELTDFHRQLIGQIESISKELSDLKNTSHSSKNTLKSFQREESSKETSKVLEKDKEKWKSDNLLILKCIAFLKMHNEYILGKAKFMLSKGKLRNFCIASGAHSKTGSSGHLSLPSEVNSFFKPYSNIKMSLDLNSLKKMYGETSCILQEFSFIFIFLKEKDLPIMQPEAADDDSTFISSLIKLAHKNARDRLSLLFEQHKSTMNLFNSPSDKSPGLKVNEKANVLAFVRLIFLKKFEKMKVQHAKFKKNKRFKLVNMNFETSNNNVCKRSNRYSRNKSYGRLPSVESSKNQLKIKEYLKINHKKKAFLKALK